MSYLLRPNIVYINNNIIVESQGQFYIVHKRVPKKNNNTLLTEEIYIANGVAYFMSQGHIHSDHIAGAFTNSYHISVFKDNLTMIDDYGMVTKSAKIYVKLFHNKGVHQKAKYRFGFETIDNAFLKSVTPIAKDLSLTPFYLVTKEMIVVARFALTKNRRIRLPRFVCEYVLGFLGKP